MERGDQIEAIVDFVHRHPESLASQVIRRETTGFRQAPAEQVLQDKLGELDEETLTGYYYLVR